jgi:AcrR family transcriptional regulator
VKKAYHHGELRDALVNEALAALEREGELPSWRALARACGVSQSAPYRHFADLAALRSAGGAACFRRLTEHIRAALATQTDPYRRLVAGSTAYVAFGRAHPAWYGIMFRATAGREPPPETAEAATEAFGTLVDAVGACGVDEPLPVAFVLWTGQHGLVDILRLNIRVKGVSSEALLEREMEMHVAYVQTVVARAKGAGRAPKKRPR